MKRAITYSIVVMVALLLSVPASVLGQDFHLSQYENNPQYTNPALTGIYNRENVQYRVNLNHRNQWSGIFSKGFRTYSVAYDMPYKQFGLGAIVLDNKAGTGQFNSLNVLLSGSYKITGEKPTVHELTTGIQLGFFQKSFDPTKLWFDSQYSGTSPTGYDQGIPNMEDISKQRIFKLDASLGAYYRYVEQGKKLHPYGGLAFFHALMPNESFIVQKSRLPVRMVLHSGVEYQVNDDLILDPRIAYMTQRKAGDLNIGLLSRYRFHDEGYEAIAGVGVRTKDAVILQVGFGMDAFELRFSYDVGTSYLREVTNNSNAFEFSLVYRGVK